MEREIYFDCSMGQIRAAVLEDGKLCEVHCEKSASQKLTETIFLGRIEQVRPSVCAAFVDIGLPLNAFLPLEEGEKLRCGDMIIVQGAAKQASENKGLRVSRKINLAGKWLVLVPCERGIHVSKKVKDTALRDELLSIAKELCPDECALIVRTASEGVTAETMKDEAEHLYAQWKEIQLRAGAAGRPRVLSESQPLDIRLIRDVAGKNLTRITTNDALCFERLQKEKEEGHIFSSTELVLYEEKQMLLFDVFGIEPQIEKALKKRVWLPSGGYLIIDACEAMTVFDVNSGKMILGKDTEDTAYRVNLEAADEISRQLRLRDIGGIVVIDFIDMQLEEHREAVIERMKSVVKSDRSPVKVEGITKLGLLELTRKRVNASLAKSLQCSCSYCSGTGALYTPEETAFRALRQIRRMALGGQRGPFCIRCAPAAVNSISMMENPIDAPVYVQSVSSKHAERFEIEQLSLGKTIPKGAEILKKGSKNEKNTCY